MNNNQNLMGIFTFIVALATLIAWLMWAFVPAGMQAPTTPSEPVVAPTPAPTPTPTPTPAPQPTPAPAATSIDVAELNSFYEDVYIQWNADAWVTIIEFTDMQCPFCQRHSNNGTLGDVLASYGDDVNVVTAHFPLSFHPLAQDAGEAMECAAEQNNGSESYYTMKDELFALGANPTAANIRTAATNAGFDADAIADCVDADTYAQKVRDQMAFGRQLGVTWTPGNIVMNNETGDFVKVSWAVPAAAFDAAITQFLN